jgi:hypothetical protein
MEATRVTASATTWRRHPLALKISPFLPESVMYGCPRGHTPRSSTVTWYDPMAMASTLVSIFYRTPARCPSVVLHPEG